MKLSIDSPRCDGKDCDERHECARYLQRHLGVDEKTPRITRPSVIAFFCENIVPVTPEKNGSR